ncbi:hypothetical protein F9G31_17160 [Salmonella enterica subsp. enterica serovar Mbandaka]|nr:hypothetical protein [Salmonella enterica subsp. enterica serovar Mbandaka]EDI8591001.1 hypothetical protein [Salmonella enterica subsp. enterica serovar Mbandaka]HDX5341611.1 hypothetical protein [Citrobacter sedlakii]HEJ0064930.1 hypothetical protein [Citrobacter koseri]HEM8489965.1 hypothetical protein [Citrobacter koseri]
MKREPKKTVKIKRFRYSLDWFTVDDVECEVGNGFSYEMQFRLGAWYLMGKYYDYKAEQWYEDYSKSFQLEHPADAVIELGDSLRAFSRLHNCDQLTKHLSKLLKEVAARIAIREEAGAAQ